MFIINPNSGIPIYRQIVDQIRRMISGRQLKPGDALPSVRELALLHDISPMTISKAYSLAEAEGYLLRQRGKPMMVAAQSDAQDNKQQRLNKLQPLIDQTVDAARQLDLSAADITRLINKKWKES